MTTGSRLITDSLGTQLSVSWAGQDRNPNSPKSECHNYSKSWSRRKIGYALYAPGGPSSCDLFRANYPSGNWLMDYNSGPATIWDANAELNLLQKLTSKVRGSEFNLGVSLSQGHQVVQQTLNTLAAFTASYRSLRRGDAGGAIRALGLLPGQRDRAKLTKHLKTADVSGAWLAMQYGWLPTLADLHGSWKAYEALTAPARSTTIVVRHQVVKEYEGSNSPSNFSALGTKRHSVVIRYKMTEELSNERRLNLLDPVGAAWEALPGSFIADWFVPIGLYIEVLGLLPSLHSSYIRSEKMTYNCHFSNWSSGIAPLMCGIPVEAIHSGGSIARICGADASQIAIPLPGFKPLPQSLSSGHIKNAVALLASVITNKPVFRPLR